MEIVDPDEYLKRFKTPKQTSERQFYVQMACDHLDDQNFNKINGMLRHLKGGKIRQIEGWIKQSKDGRNPQALFYWYIKNSRCSTKSQSSQE